MELHAQDGTAPHNNQSQNASNDPAKTHAIHQKDVEIPSTAPADDPTTRGQGLDRYLKRHHITGKVL